MTWFDWFLLSWISLGAVAGVLLIGKQRAPITPVGALVGLGIGVFIVLGILEHW